MSKTKNQACPFCGGQARVISRGYNDGGKWTDWVSVTCPADEGGCGASQAATTEKEAWKKWNTRAGGREPATPESTGVKALASATCSAASVEKERALMLWMDEVLAVLSYQPDIPLAHKADIAKAQTRYKEAVKAEWQQNAELSHAPTRVAERNDEEEK